MMRLVRVYGFLRGKIRGCYSGKKSRENCNVVEQGGILVRVSNRLLADN